MFANLTGVHALVILAVVLLLFGAAKLPALAKSLGQSVRILKDETKEQTPTEAAEAAAAADTTVPAATTSATPVTNDNAYVAPAQVQAQRTA